MSPSRSPTRPLPCWETPLVMTEVTALLVGVLSGGCSGYMYDLQIVESTETPCQELNIDGFRVLVPTASSHLLDGIEIDYVDRLMGGGSKSTIQMPAPRAVAVNPSLEALAWAWQGTMPTPSFFREPMFGLHQRVVHQFGDRLVQQPPSPIGRSDHRCVRGGSGRLKRCAYWVSSSQGRAALAPQRTHPRTADQHQRHQRTERCVHWNRGIQPHPKGRRSTRATLAPCTSCPHG